MNLRSALVNFVSKPCLWEWKILTVITSESFVWYFFCCGPQVFRVWAQRPWATFQMEYMFHNMLEQRFEIPLLCLDVENTQSSHEICLELLLRVARTRRYKYSCAKPKEKHRGTCSGNEWNLRVRRFPGIARDLQMENLNRVDKVLKWYLISPLGVLKSTSIGLEVGLENLRRKSFESNKNAFRQNKMLISSISYRYCVGKFITFTSFRIDEQGAWLFPFVLTIRYLGFVIVLVNFVAQRWCGAKKAATPTVLFSRQFSEALFSPGVFQPSGFCILRLPKESTQIDFNLKRISIDSSVFGQLYCCVDCGVDDGEGENVKE